jgi:hypothetical protein
MWYEWDSLEVFNAWHASICEILGIPDEQTLDYTKAFEVEDKVIAVVHSSEADGLILTDLRPSTKIGEHEATFI